MSVSSHSCHGHHRCHRREPSPSPPPRPPRRASTRRSPQDVINDFWSGFEAPNPGKVTSIIPHKAYAAKVVRHIAGKAAVGARSTAASYAEAADQCRAKIAHIVKECRRVNQKYRDMHFDLELDLQTDRRDCLDSLNNYASVQYDSKTPAGVQGRAVQPQPIGVDTGVDTGLAGPPDRPPNNRLCDPPVPCATSEFQPRAVKRVDDIFDSPKFFIDGPNANDVRQGRDGDCWLMAALCTMSNKRGLIERVCVAHDAAVGVYGFVFHRDGEWISEIIDDKLYLTKPDYDESHYERYLFEDRVRVDSEETYRRIYQSNSGALYFAQCKNPNETWLPLLEKAYAKAHGDYAAIEGGFTGEGIEDLTGGVTSELYTTDILDKEHFWKEELMKVNDLFLFGCSTGVWGNGRGERGGIVELHAYSVMRAVEMDGMRLVLLKNPWGRHEWKGAWSDGSKEWTPEWLQKLNHQFGDDGAFWISYTDLLRKYQTFDRTRLFGDDWHVASIWTSMTVPWTLEYNDTHFAFTLARPGPVVLVLSQLDDRYFRGLEGQYVFKLSMRLHKDADRRGDSDGDGDGGGDGDGNSDRDSDDERDEDAEYVVRTQASYRMSRSCSVELTLDAGRYRVLVKIDARRYDGLMRADEVVRANVHTRREKLIGTGLAYDVAHSKGQIPEDEDTPAETRAEKKDRRAAAAAAAAARKARAKRRLKKEVMADRALRYLAAQIHVKTQRKMAAKKEAKRAARAARQEARRREEEEKKKKLKAKAEADAKVKTEVKVKTEEADQVKLDDGMKTQGEISTATDAAASVSAAKTGAGEASQEAPKPVEMAAAETAPETSDSKPAETSSEKTDERPAENPGAKADSAPADEKPADEKPADEKPANDEADDEADDKQVDVGDSSQSSLSEDKSTPAISVSDKEVVDAADADKEDDGAALPKTSQPEDDVRSGETDGPGDKGSAQGMETLLTPPSDEGDGEGHASHSDKGSERGLRSGRSSTQHSRQSSRDGRGACGRGASYGPSHHEQEYDDADVPRSRGRGDSRHGGASPAMSDISSVSSPSEISDDELELMYESRKREHERQRHHGREQRSASPSMQEADGGYEEEEEEDETDDIGDPWNAIAVVGLRVYYQTVAGDDERLAAAAAAAADSKTADSKTADSKKRDAKKGDAKTTGTKAAGTRTASEQGADSDAIVQLSVERPRPAAEESQGEAAASDSSSDSDSDSDSGCDSVCDVDSDNSGDGGDADDADGAEEKVLDMDDSLKDVTAVVQDWVAHKERRGR